MILIFDHQLQNCSHSTGAPVVWLLLSHLGVLFDESGLSLCTLTREGILGPLSWEESYFLTQKTENRHII